MRVCLIDVDSTIPNIALMKLSRYHKNKGDEVTLHRAKISYYPSKKKEYKVPTGYDLSYASIIFKGSKDYLKGDNIIYGGTGVDLTSNLSEEIEQCEPDYSIYPNNDISYGFISRGCIRNCSFCVVPKKEGKIKQVATVADIVKHKKVKFLDNNFLALPNHKDILNELVSKQIKFQFNQGLDIRLIDEENSELLSQCNHLEEIYFAYDDVALTPLISKKLDIMKWLKPYRAKFFVYVHPDMPLSDTVERIEWLKERKQLPYLMRDVECWNSTNNRFYIDYAAYCNQPRLFKNMTFLDFLSKRHKDNNRIKQSREIYNSATK